MATTRSGPPCRPSEQMWIDHKSTIIRLYRKKTLKEVMREMEKYNFNATKRMYDTKFRNWGVNKILTREEKKAIARHIAGQHTSGHSDTIANVSENDKRKTMRWIASQLQGSKTVDKRKKMTSPKPTNQYATRQALQPSRNEDDSDSSRCHRTMGSQSPQSDYLRLDPDSSTPNASMMELSSPGTTFTPSSEDTISQTSFASPNSTDNSLEEQLVPFPSPPMALSPALRNQEHLFSNIRTYTLSQIADSASHPRDNPTIAPSTDMNLFWNNIKNGIYLLKIASKFPDTSQRATAALKEAKSLTPMVLSNDPPLAFVRDLLATLSPANTSIQPSVRIDVLSQIAIVASACDHLGPFHPITMICLALQNDGRDSAVSLAGLYVMLDIITNQFGFFDQAYYKMMKTIISFTRRSGDLETAKTLAQGELDIASFCSGVDSDPARNAAVELAHILTKLGDHGRALSLRMRVVRFPWSGLREAAALSDDMQLLRNDTLSIHTMEDLAEYYVRFGNGDEATKWLMRAKAVADVVWGDSAATGHIADKLENILNGQLQGQVLDM